MADAQQWRLHDHGQPLHADFRVVAGAHGAFSPSHHCKASSTGSKGLTRNRTQHQTQVAVLALGFCKNPCRGSNSLHLLPASASIGLFVVACETMAVAAATFLPNATGVMYFCNVAAGGTAMLFDYYMKTIRLCSQATKVKALVAKASTPGCGDSVVWRARTP